MRKYLTTGLFSAILGIVIGGAPADAALVSRGFLDEALENYATTTALDLKANQSDFTELSDKIGILPEGITVQGMYEGWTDENGVLANPGLKGIYEGWIGHNGLHTLGLQELELDFFYIYNPENDSPQELRGQRGGLLYVLNSLLSSNGGFTSSEGGLAPFWKLTQSAYKTDELSAKIGTLPSGPIGNSPAMDYLFRFTQGTDTPVFPNSLSDLINQLYGSTGGPGAITALLNGFEGFGVYGVPVGILPAMDLGLSATRAAETAITTATEAKTAADANTAKIGTLPTEYATVGAALTAIKGIAEEAKAAALAAIPDPKTEGSTGKFVLTVDIVGDNATYRWEKIDREGETTTTE